MIPRPPKSTLFPYTTRFPSSGLFHQGITGPGPRINRFCLPVHHPHRHKCSRLNSVWQRLCFLRFVRKHERSCLGVSVLGSGAKISRKEISRKEKKIPTHPPNLFPPTHPVCNPSDRSFRNIFF